MAAATAIFNQHSDVRVEHGALIFPMPVECYDRLMDSESLPRGSSYNGPRRALEVDAVPNGRYHDPRAFAVAELLTELRRTSGVPATSAQPHRSKAAKTTGVIRTRSSSSPRRSSRHSRRRAALHRFPMWSWKSTPRR